MLDVEKLQSAHETIHVEPSDRIFEELGNNTYDFKDLISELIDNSIAARRSDRMLNVTVEIWVDQRNTAKRILVRDDGLGIPQDRFGLAVSPAGIQTPNSLNEHGLGMKQAIAGLGELAYIATKNAGEQKARVIRQFKFGDINCFLSDFDQDSGTEICIEHVKPIANANPQSITMTLAPYLGARYRRFLKPDSKSVNISVFTKNVDSGSVQYSWEIEEVKPIYFHPSTRLNKPVILNKKLKGSGWKAELTFGYAPTDEELKELGIDSLPHYHPYKVSLSKQGLDVILYDRVVLFHQLSELELVAARHPDYNLIRGEIVLLEGFSTAITKNSIIRDDHFTECIKDVKDILTGKDEDDSRNYLRQKKYPREIPEKLLRDRLANWLGNNPINKKDDVKTEYTVEGLAGSIDILADGEAWEVKRDQADGLDVYQLFAYMDMGQISKGYLAAASFSTGADVAKDFINKHHQKEISLAKLEQFPINHPPSDDERNTYY
ncbi:MAG: hypothetical protein DRI01_04585 [Chloroflexi bacterium]|nr:MAG: hypothetical protein DRI01_04585 [Chloroflexota bacterium]